MHCFKCLFKKEKVEYQQPVGDETWGWFIDIPPEREHQVYLVETTNLCNNNSKSRFKVIQEPPFYKTENENKEKEENVIKASQLLFLLLVVDAIYIGLSYL
jgi:hypothetical protein